MSSPVRIVARPGPPTQPALAPGDHRLGLGTPRDVTLFVPRSYAAEVRAPLVLCLHGAGGAAAQRIDPLRKHAQRVGALLVAPEVFVTHGRWDTVLNVACSRRIVEELRARGVPVEYREFRGIHLVPDRFAREAFDRLR